MSRAKKFLTLLFICLFNLVSTARADPPRAMRKPMIQTSLSRTELLGALREGHQRVFGTLPNKSRLAMAWGQVAFENGHGKYSFNHNLGNVGPSGSGQLVYFNDGDKHFYRHFDNFVDGAAAYWEVLKRCSAALIKFDSGDPKEASRILKRCGYYEADLDVYTKGFTSLYYFALNNVFLEEQREKEERERQLELQRACEPALSTSTARASFCYLGCH